MTDAVVLFRPVVTDTADPSGGVEAWTLSQDPVRLPGRSAALGAPVLLSMLMEYRTIDVAASGRRGFVVVPRAYWFRVAVARDVRTVDAGDASVDDGRELALWHLHPYGRSTEWRPHLHVADGPLSGMHLLSGPVTVVHVLRVVLAELEVPSRRADWRTVLDRAEQALDGGTRP